VSCQTPSDARSNQFEEPKGATWRVFAIEGHDPDPLAIVEVDELRQQNPPSLWAALVRNRSSAAVDSFILAAAIVTGDGTVKAIQRLPAIKNLKPNQMSRQQMRVTATVLMPTDRVVFFVAEVSRNGGSSTADENAVCASIKQAVTRLPIP
jgi:hypothetical protein